MTYSMVGGDAGVGDMCLIEPLNEDNFIQNLELRFSKNLIYTYIGNVVVSVNPYKHLDIYDTKVIQEYKGKNIYEMPPHVYAIADGAYSSMRDHNLDQCVIICGESGAGKTEASKTIMQYVAEVSGKGSEIDRVKEKLLQSNPILEAFGNAKTNKNDNSSRFGKYMDVEFDFKGDPLGGVISSYLLEKSRLVFQSKGERSFHIFYQLLNSTEAQFLADLHLKADPDAYNYLNKSACVSVPGINDTHQFSLTKKAMDILAFSNEDVTFIFKMLAVILNVGNFQFTEINSKNGMDGCGLDVDEKDLKAVAYLVGCEPQAITEALTKRTVITNNDSVQTELTCSEASYARDAICKALYARMLTWMIGLINDTIKVSSNDKMKSMGVLDIYGFEIFEHNSFEQFIINYCNEKLQQIFIDLTLKEEQAEYVNEGIEWIHVDYFNNSIICELIEKNNTGILSLLDEECLLPGDTSDHTFLMKVTDVCGSHAHFESRSGGKGKSDRSLEEDQFRLVHYAGNVTYNIAGFLDKNSDLLFKDLSRMMYAGKHPQLKLLFPDGDPEKMNLKRPATAGYQFKVSVAELMKNLLTKSPNYIRCIKPNHYKRRDNFVESLVRHQVRYLGLMENVRVRRAGYAYRQKYQVFLHRYKMLSKETWPRWNGGSVGEGVSHLMKMQDFGEDEYAMGRSKIFIRNPKTLFSLEGRRKEHLNTIATLISARYRCWIAQRKYKEMKAAQITISAFYRGYWQRMEYNKIKEATAVICSCVRGWQVRRLYRQKFKAVAGPKVFKFLRRALMYRYLISLRKNLPSSSPLDGKVPVRDSGMFKEVSEHLRRLHHKNRCLQYIRDCSEEKRKILKVKLKASELFLNKKFIYAKSVSVPFKGDHLNLPTNPKWVKKDNEEIIFSDKIIKINRKDGKTVPHILALTNGVLSIVDARSYKTKSTIPLPDISFIKMSPMSDCIAVFNLKEQTAKKGDLIVACFNLVELVTITTITSQLHHKHTIPVSYAKNIETSMYGVPVEIAFKEIENNQENNKNSNNLNDDLILNGTQVFKRKDKFEIIN